MSRRWILSVLSVLLALAALPASAAKPVPAPSSPTIVEQLGPFVIASDGTVYEYTETNTTTCGPSLTSAVVYGRFFTTPPVSPIASVATSARGLRAILANGDMWLLSQDGALPCYLTGLYMGNIFTVAGAATAAETFGTIEDSPANRVSPNPTAGTSRIEYATPKAGPVSVRIFDASGRLVRSIAVGHAAAGTYSVAWDGTTERGERAANGVYFAKVGLPDGTESTGRVVVAR